MFPTKQEMYTAGDGTEISYKEMSIVVPIGRNVEFAVGVVPNMNLIDGEPALIRFIAHASVVVPVETAPLPLDPLPSKRIHFFSLVKGSVTFSVSEIC